MSTERFFVIVSGAPGSGKTTLARPLADELRLPLVRKDAIKETLGEIFGADDYAASHRLGGISVQLLRALMRDVGFGVYESPWRPEFDLADLSRLPGPKVEVFCDCDRALRLQRIADRAASRHPVHFDLGHMAATSADDPSSRPLGGPWPLIEVDTRFPVDTRTLADRIRLAVG